MIRALLAVLLMGAAFSLVAAPYPVWRLSARYGQKPDAG